MTENKQQQYGMNLIELAIVVSLIAIVVYLLNPNFYIQLFKSSTESTGFLQDANRIFKKIEMIANRNGKILDAQKHRVTLSSDLGIFTIYALDHPGTLPPFPSGSEGPFRVAFHKHHTNKLAICHAPPGNPSNAHTLDISISAYNAHHSNHPDDYFGPCEGESYRRSLLGDGIGLLDDPSRPGFEFSYFTQESVPTDNPEAIQVFNLKLSFILNKSNAKFQTGFNLIPGEETIQGHGFPDVHDEDDDDDEHDDSSSKK